ncbi:nucleotide disphospho-sugar-binding domain-containing protein [Streptomyces sp. NPDC019890]|uniref:nucleotide disphospho-sugar-binding domain-containing protein n=1 Tax=Streptomyces sp. NPDC019890 TaxID=3365064 RepID=UPI00384E0BFB
MRILATSAPNQGHLYPMISTLWALRNAGHEVLAALPDRFARLTAEAGISSVAVAEDFRLGDLGTKRAQQGSSIAELTDHIIDYYVPATERTVDRTVAVADTWRPDLILCTDWEYAAPIAAGLIGVPTVLHGWGLLADPAVDEPIAEALRPIRRKWGLGEEAHSHWKIIDNCPPELQWRTPPANAVPSRYVPFNGAGVMPQWLFEQPDAPRVLVTLGNAPIGGDHANVLQRTVQALTAFDLDVVIAVGDHIKLDQLGERPARTRLIHTLPLSQVLPTCTAVIHHGGAGSAMAATAAGLPQLGLPQMCVQYQHADRIAEVGAARVLHPEEASVEAIRESVRSVLEEPGLQEVAWRLQNENAARTGLDETVRLLETAFEAEGR